MALVGFMVIYWIAPAENCSSLFLKKKNLFYDLVDDLRKKGEKSWWFESLPGILLWNFSRQIWSSRFASTWPSQRGIKGTMIRSKNLENPLAFLVMHYLQCLHYLHCITMYYLYYLHNMHQLYHLWLEQCTWYTGRVAEVAREHRWHPQKSLDSDENFKTEHTLFCRVLRFVAIYALFFGDLWA